MYNPQAISERIKRLAKSRKIQLRTMLGELDLGINTISKMANGSDVMSQSVVKIADYLNCSTDYLYGRTNNLNSHIQQPTNTVSGNYNAVDNSSITVGSLAMDEHQKLLVELYNQLQPIEQIELIAKLNQMIRKED